MRKVRLVALPLLLVLLVVGAARAADRSERFGTYIQAAVSDEPFEKVAHAVEGAVPASGLQLLATRDLELKVEGARARVYVLAAPKLTQLVAAKAPRWTAALLPQRLEIYQVGGKVAVGYVNPVALAYVFTGAPVQVAPEDARAIVTGAQEVERELRSLVREAGLTLQPKDLAPRRTVKELDGYNGDSMGKVMAGSKNFHQSLQVILEFPVEGSEQASFAKACRQVEENFGRAKNGWRIISTLDTGNLTRVYGVTQGPAEQTAVHIESMFRSDKSSANPAPGVDHAAAFPMELLVFVDGGKVKVAHFGQMWRMQYYFWDAGYAAFTANVGVPGRIFTQLTAAATGK